MTKQQLMKVHSGAEELVSEAQLAEGFDRLAAELQPLIDKDDCILLAIMTGGFYPLYQLVHRLTGDYRVDNCHCSRYQAARTPGALNWISKPYLPLQGQTVIVVDDILDEGVTLNGVAAYCHAAGAAKVLTAVQVIKNTARRAAHVKADFSTGLTVPDRFVFGCGMDLASRWRHLPAIYALPEQVS